MKTFTVSGMSCAACSARVERAVSKVNGVEACSVNLLTAILSVEGSATNDTIIKAVTDAGYGAASAEDERDNISQNAGNATANSATQNTSARAKTHRRPQDSTETARLLRRFLVSALFLLPLMYVSMGHTMFHFPIPAFFAPKWCESFIAAALQLLFSSIILCINRTFFVSGTKALLRAAPNMDTLVSLGSGISYMYSVCVFAQIAGATFYRNAESTNRLLHTLYFESAAMILVLITLGKFLESLSKGKTTSALKSLLSLAPKTATLLINGTETVVPVERVKTGDVFTVKAGNSIPVDGVVLGGSASVDESSLTGESVYVDKVTGSTVSAGTLNINGFLQCRATRVGSDTTFSQIIKTVNDSTATKAPIAKVADTVSLFFVPTVIAAAVITFTVWFLAGAELSFALTKAVCVLVVSCPCALGLATPVAIMVANGVGAKNGILFKTSGDLENLGKTQIIALDKTGTITKGKPEVTQVIPFDAVTKTELLQFAYIIEEKSEHPLAKAVTRFAEKNNVPKLELTDFTEIGGKGIRATVKSERQTNGACTVYGGNLNFIKESCPTLFDSALGKPNDFTKTITNTLTEIGKKGQTPILFAATESENGTQNQKFLGFICLSDSLKEESRGAITELKKMGIKPVMLTGDNQLTAAAVAQQCGIEHIIAGVLPNEKQHAVLKLKTHGKTCMVGDGINDAPSLVSADIGIAIGAGSDIALEAANVVLVKSHLDDCVHAIRLSKKTLKTIHENLFWAFFYNITLIPLAAGVYHNIGLDMNPMFGALAMSLSSFCVVMNALRLNLFRKKAIINDTEQTMTTTINVKGMMCAHCEAHVKQALEQIDGVTKATARHETGEVLIETSKTIDRAAFIKAIIAAGYEAE